VIFSYRTPTQRTSRHRTSTWDKRRRQSNSDAMGQ
jgi:hypothetical protein